MVGEAAEPIRVEVHRIDARRASAVDVVADAIADVEGALAA